VLRETYDRLTVQALAVSRDPASADPHADPAVDGEVDRRGVDAIRFDVFTATAPPSATGGPGSSGTTVLVALSTLLGADDRPGELSGYGPVPAWMARRAAADARLRRVLTDPLTGQLVAIDGHTYPAGWLTPQAAPSGSSGSSSGAAEVVRRTIPPGPTAALACVSTRPPAVHAPPPASPPAPPPPTAGTGAADPPACAPTDPPPCVPVRGGDCPVQAAGASPYAIPAHTARLVRARTPRCTAPGCRVPAARCDLDHVVRHPQGPTCACNLSPLCRRHHRMKHRATSWRRWQVHRCEAGHVHWTSPLGRQHVVAPEPLLPPHDPSAGAPPPEPPEPLRYPPDLPPRSPTPRSSPQEEGAEGAEGADGAGPPTDPWAGMDPDTPPF